MTALQQLEMQLNRLERRLRLLVSAEGLAASAASALALTVGLVWIGNRYRFATGVVLPLRVLLYLCVATVLTFALAVPLLRIKRSRVARLAESRIPDFNQQLLTVVERPDAANPFTELVAEDALQVLRERGTEALAPSRLLYGVILGGACAIAILLWMIAAAPGYWGYGASLLWTGAAHAGSRPMYDIAVQPGNRVIRRKSDQVISAQLLGFSHPNVVLHAKYREAAKWDAIPMQPQPEGNGYRVLFSGLADSLEYYVQAGDIQSKHFTVGVKDLAAVKRVKVELHFPSGIGLPDSVEDPGGDIRAVQGSQARISVLTDKPLPNGVLVLENGARVTLAAGQNQWLTATLPITKDGSYHFAALDGSDTVRISDDYFIEAKKDEAPSVRILKPGRDAHVSPIEEVPVTVEASDDFGVNTLQLHYSVNGGSEQVTSFPRGTKSKEAQGKTTLYFENFKLVPGDLVSFYATAQDATHTSRSDIVFAQAEPFDLKFRQSQQAGGGGGSGGEQESKISERQKQIIAATWNELKDVNKERSTVAENARFLSDLENKLSDQAKALAARMRSRDLDNASPEFQQFSTQMLQAASDMSGAVQQLKPAKWDDALPLEQKALQSLLRAESLFRDIQVAFGQRGGGGGMGGGGDERELARLFDLELDSSKNQYETGQSASASGSDQQKQIDDAMERLKELAKRQQELAEQPHTQGDQFQQRWQEEQLRREAEQLRQQMEQMAKNAQSGQPESSQSQEGGQQSSAGSSSQSSSRQSSSSRQQSRPAGQAADNRQNQQAMRQALDSLTRAEEEMRNAVSNRDGSAQARAASQLAQAQESLRNMLHQQTGQGVSDMAEQARQLAGRQKDLANKVKKMYGAEGINTARSESQPGAGGAGSPEMPEMDGPDYAGGWYRRQFSPTLRPGRANDQEKSLAGAGAELSRQMQDLQSQLQHQVQSMRSDQPEAARKVGRAISDAEQEELALRMQKMSDWLRQGYGSQTWPMEDSITAGVEHLSRQLDEAQQSLNSGKQGNGSGQDEKLSQALSQVRSLRQQLENRSSGASGRGQDEKSTQVGSQPGAGYSPRGGGRAEVGGGDDTQDALDELSTLRSEYGRGDRQLNNSLDGAIGSLRQVKAQAGRLDAVLNQDAVTKLERLELELTRRISAMQSGARTGAPESSPAKYREALAEYFRRLSK